MPFINTKTNVTISKEQELKLKTRFGKAIEQIPGKTEARLMLDFESERRMYFSGGNTPMAMVEVKLFGSTSAKAYDNTTSALTEVLSQELGIEPSRIYVKYEECFNWGCGGKNF